MKLYLSGKMSGVKDLNKPLFNRLTRKLRKAGYIVVNPPELDLIEPQFDWSSSLKRDIKYLVDCGGVATIKGWETSRGANLEIYIAKALGIPVKTIESWLEEPEK